MEQENLQNQENLMDINSDSEIPGNTHLSNNEEAIDPLEALQTELNEQKDKYLRLFAEFDNFKKRSAKERFEYLQTAGKDVIIGLLEVLDDMDRAEKQMETSEDIAAIKEGIALVFNKLRTNLQNRGLKLMETVGKEFNPDEHEAVTEIPNEEMGGKVVDEISKGYYLNDKIIRFAKVVVAK